MNIAGGVGGITISTQQHPGPIRFSSDPVNSPSLLARPETSPPPDVYQPEVGRSIDKDGPRGNDEAYKALKKGIKGLFKAVKGETKDLLKAIGVDKETRHAVQDLLKDLKSTLRDSVKAQKYAEGGNTDAVIGDVERAFGSFISELDEILGSKPVISSADAARADDAIQGIRQAYKSNLVSILDAIGFGPPDSFGDPVGDPAEEPRRNAGGLIDHGPSGYGGVSLNNHQPGLVDISG